MPLVSFSSGQLLLTNCRKRLVFVINPVLRVSYFGFVFLSLNIQWIGDVNRLDSCTVLDTQALE